MSTYRKKLIEVALPLSIINDNAAYEKLPGIGPHPRGIHHWWARRPLTICRSILFAQLVDDPGEWPRYFPGPEDVAAERMRLHHLIEELSNWKRSGDERILAAAQLEIARTIARVAVDQASEDSVADHQSILNADTSPSEVSNYLQKFAPPVYDPFAGGGSIPIEAMRLGLQAFGSDLNPVAVLLNKFLLDLGPRCAKVPTSSSSQELGSNWDIPRMQTVADDLKHYGRLVLQRARENSSGLYAGNGETDRGPIAWLWCRTVPSPDPVLQGKAGPSIVDIQPCKAKEIPNLARTASSAWKFRMGI